MIVKFRRGRRFGCCFSLLRRCSANARPAIRSALSTSPGSKSKATPCWMRRRCSPCSRASPVRRADFGYVERAMDALQGAYRKRGFGLVKVILPEQELNRGVVHLKVVETRIGKVRVEGNAVSRRGQYPPQPARREGGRDSQHGCAVGRFEGGQREPHEESQSAAARATSSRA